MSAIDDIVAQLPMSSLAGQVGSDPQTTETAVRQVLPALLGGLHANAQDPAGASSLAGALGQHSPDLVEGGVNLDQVDPQDGSRIVSNIFGGQTGQGRADPRRLARRARPAWSRSSCRYSPRSCCPT